MKELLFIFCFCVFFSLFGGSGKKADREQLLVDQYIQSKGADIVFDASNAKQFWVDKSVSCKDNVINLILEKNEKGMYESKPMKIQLVNVCETQDCKVTILTVSKDFSFQVTSLNNPISQSVQEATFLQYHVYSATIHMEETDFFSFNLMFHSSLESISIKQIILSFSQNINSAFLGSLGFNNLLERIQREGKKVSNSDIKYILDPQNNKIFIMIPNELLLAHSYYYQIIPEKKSDLDDKSKKYNGKNFNIKKEKNAIIPKPYMSTSNYSIIQLSLPSYPYIQVFIGQYSSGKKVWMITLP